MAELDVIPYLKNEYLKDGEKVMISTEVKYVEGRFPAYKGVILTSDDRKYIANFNKTSLTLCSAKWGNKTDKWVDKFVSFNLETFEVGGREVEGKVFKPVE